ncbi:hypothetical protein [Vallitalea okinawensis]|uniref:hypothetical protein n=1 Tax=Vallitalea okinawensis TaxID=2078660 RepID=UPI000CFE32D7|nr:hypothetical protein [Vallitalea okinawensis]
MDKVKPQAFYPGRNYDQRSWVLEKTESSLKQLLVVVDILNEECNENENMLDENISQNLSAAIVDLFKLYSFWIGDMEIYSFENLDVILKEGTRGLNRILNQHGIDGKTYIDSNIEDEKWMDSIKKLITLESNNRTLIYEYLSHITVKTELIKRLELNLEKVTLGELTWEEFVINFKNKRHE